MNKYIQFLIILVLGAVVIFLASRNHGVQTVVVTDFASCQAAGGLLTDGDPVTCTSSDGQVFAESQSVEAEVVIDQPTFGALVKSPLRVSGKARGNWYFEANLPVVLKDENGKVLAQKGFHALGDWMTTDYVPFDDVLAFPTPETDYGVLIISKDNPSGEPQFDASYAVPVKFR